MTLQLKKHCNGIKTHKTIIKKQQSTTQSIIQSIFSFMIKESSIISVVDWVVLKFIGLSYEAWN